MSQLIPNPDGSVTEQPAPAELASNSVTLLQLYGNMTFAGAETLEQFLPKAGNAVRPVVILRLRAQEGIGSSFVTVLERYSNQIQGAGGKLMVAGVNRKVKGQLDRTEATGEILGAENVFVATTALGASTAQREKPRQRWLEETSVESTMTQNEAATERSKYNN